MPFGNLFDGPHLIIFALVLLVLFGATKLPIFAKGLGQSIKIFRKEVGEVKDDAAADKAKRAATVEDREVVTTPETTRTRDASEDR